MADEFIIAATGCPTGVAHTFMAEASLIKAAKARGIDIKVETHGQVGIENELTPEDIARATGVIIAADKDVQSERFAGKPLVEVGVKAGIHEPDALIDRVLAAAAQAPAAGASVAGVTAAGAATAAGSDADADGDMLDIASIRTDGDTAGRRFARTTYKNLMNGVSHMLPFVVGGGVLMAVSFLWGIYSAEPGHEQYNAFAAALKTIGGTAMSLMVPVLSAFIAESIAKRPGLTVGLVTGLIAANAGTGFLGGILTGFLSGYGMLFLARVLKRLPASLNGLKAIFLFPVLGSLIFGLITVVLSAPMAAVSVWLQGVLGGFQDANPILLGIILGSMCAVDMGGPINKAAYVTGVALLGEGNVEFMAAVAAACMTPPLVTAVAATIFPQGFDPAERRAAMVNYVLGSTLITEGAIPFAARSPLKTIPTFMLGSAVSSALVLLWHVAYPAPHGGFLVLPVVTHPLQFVLAILIGALVGGVVYGLVRLRGAKDGVPEADATADAALV